MALLAAGAVTWARARRSRIGPLLVLAGATWLAGDVCERARLRPSGAARARPPHVSERADPVAADRGGDRGRLPRRAGPPDRAFPVGDDRADGRRSVRRGVAVGRRPWPRAPHPCGLRSPAQPPSPAPLDLAAVGRLAELDMKEVATWAYEAAIATTAAALAVDLLRAAPVRAAATGLVVDLADRQEPRALRGALARAVGDPGPSDRLPSPRRVGRRSRTTIAIARRGEPKHEWSRSSRRAARRWQRSCTTRHRYATRRWHLLLPLPCGWPWPT